MSMDQVNALYSILHKDIVCCASISQSVSQSVAENQLCFELFYLS